MAVTSFGTNDPRTQKIWRGETMKYGMKSVALLPMMGATPDAIIFVQKELTRRPGDTIVVQGDVPMTGAGKGDDGDNTGAEVALGIRNMSILIHERSVAVRAAGQMSLQRTDIFRTEGFRRFARDRAGVWFKEAQEDDMVTAMAGLYNENSSGAEIEVINETYPSTNRIYYGGQNVGSSPALGTAYASDAALTAGTQANNLFGTLVINKIRAKALACAPRFRAGSFYQQRADNDGTSDQRNQMAMTKIADLYVILAHPYQINDMRSEIGSVGFNQLVALCAQRSDQHPIFRPGAIIWNGVIVQEYDRIPMRTGAGGSTLAEGFLLNSGRTATTDQCANTRSVARALFLGAQGLCVAWGKMLDWYEDWIDARIPKVVVDYIVGYKRTQFNAHGTTSPGEDEAIYCIDTEVKP
jgi:hypothetical protein